MLSSLTPLLPFPWHPTEPITRGGDDGGIASISTFLHGEWCILHSFTMIVVHPTQCILQSGASYIVVQRWMPSEAREASVNHDTWINSLNSLNCNSSTQFERRNILQLLSSAVSKLSITDLKISASSSWELRCRAFSDHCGWRYRIGLKRMLEKAIEATRRQVFMDHKGLLFCQEGIVMVCQLG